MDETMNPTELNEAEGLPPEELVEETEEPSEELETVFNEAQTEPETGTGQKEPGYVKSRIEKAVQKVREEMTAQFEQQMAPYKEYMLNAEAQELVRSGKVQDLETAKELIQYRQGNKPPEPKSEENPADVVRIDMLKHQADRIKAAGGPNVIAEFQRMNQEDKLKIIRGEMDFYDLAEQMKTPKRRPPSPMRSPNGASGTNPNAIDSMSDEQFARMEKRIKEGARYSLK